MDTPGQEFITTIEQLQTEHQLLLRQAGQIISMLKMTNLEECLEPLQDAFECFYIQVEGHVRREDAELYPFLDMNNSNELIRLLDSMKGEVFFLSDRLAAFSKHWTIPMIRANQEDYIYESRTILGLFAHRIDREERIFRELLKN